MTDKRDTGEPALPGPGGPARLSHGQMAMLELAAHGLRYKHIATYLGLSIRTVQGHFRLVHHAEVLTLNGDSYRTRQRRELLAKDNRTTRD